MSEKNEGNTVKKIRSTEQILVLAILLFTYFLETFQVAYAQKAEDLPQIVSWQDGKGYQSDGTFIADGWGYRRIILVDGGGCKMANPFHSTGSPIVDRMCRLQFTGNVIPAAWYRTIIRDNGKPNLTAIIILSDVVYWYRPVEIRDELTGQLCGFKKKFKADILQRNYQQLADQFGISKREAVNAVVELEKIGVVKRVFRTVRKGGMRNSNVLFLELNVDVLIQLTYPENLSDAGYHFLKGELSPYKERGATSGCDRISQSNEAYLSFEGDTNTEITEENTDIEYPLCSYQAVERAIRIQISYDALKNDHPYDRRVEEILGLILDVMVSTAPKLRINREEKAIEIVKAQFAKLTKDHVEFVLQSMDDTSTKARNIRAVLLTALYNSVNTINSYYGNRYHFHLAEETRREMEETD